MNVRLTGCGDIPIDESSCERSVYYNAEYILECEVNPDATITIPAGTYSSEVSQNDADQKAIADAIKQRIDNPCQIFWNTEQTAYCPEGYTGDPVTVAANEYSSFISQDDADAKALTAAQAALECEEILYWNTEQTATCPSGDCGDPVTIAANEYSSTISQEDADSKALAAAEAALECVSSVFCANCASDGNWFDAESGVPYSNTGNSVSGWEMLYGNAFTTDGTTINLSTDPVSLASIPSVINSDFSVSLEFKPNNSAPGEIAIGITDQDNAKTIFLGAVNPSSEENLGRAWACCDAETDGPYGFNLQENSLGIIITIGDWNDMTLSRTGSIITLTVNSTELMSYDYGSAYNGKVVIAANGSGQSWNIRNISIT